MQSSTQIRSELDAAHKQQQELEQYCASLQSELGGAGTRLGLLQVCVMVLVCPECTLSLLGKQQCCWCVIPVMLVLRSSCSSKAHKWAYKCIHLRHTLLFPLCCHRRRSERCTSSCSMPSQTGHRQRLLHVSWRQPCTNRQSSMRCSWLRQGA